MKSAAVCGAMALAAAVSGCRGSDASETRAKKASGDIVTLTPAADLEIRAAIQAPLRAPALVIGSTEPGEPQADAEPRPGERVAPRLRRRVSELDRDIRSLETEVVLVQRRARPPIERSLEEVSIRRRRLGTDLMELERADGDLAAAIDGDVAVALAALEIDVARALAAAATAPRAIDER